MGPVACRSGTTPPASSSLQDHEVNLDSKRWKRSAVCRARLIHGRNEIVHFSNKTSVPSPLVYKIVVGSALSGDLSRIGFLRTVSDLAFCLTLLTAVDI